MRCKALRVCCAHRGKWDGASILVGAAIYILLTLRITNITNISQKVRYDFVETAFENNASRPPSKPIQVGLGKQPALRHANHLQ